MKISPDYFSIDDLDLSEKDKAQVLCWYARKMWELREELCDGDFYHKRNDPLVIDLDEKEANSYVLSMEAVQFSNLEEIEQLIDKNVKDAVMEFKAD